MVLQANFQQGETVLYNGKFATACEAPFAGSTLTIEVDGKCISVDKNDLFGMNKDYTQNALDRHITQCDEQIAENKSIIKEANARWDLAKEQIKFLRGQMNSLLRSFGATTVGELGEAEQAQYKALRADRMSQRSVQIRATSDIMSAAINTASVASSKQNFLNAQRFGV